MSKTLKFVGLIILFVFPTFIMAQSSNSWTYYKDLDAVKIDYTTQQCGEEPGVITEFNFIKLTNKTSNPISVSFKLECYYNGSCSTCGNEEYVFNFEIPANGSVVPDCSLTSPNSGLAVIKRYVNRNFGYPLDRFELTNIVVH